MIARCVDHGCLLEFNRVGVTHLPSFESLAHEPSEQSDAVSVSSDRYFMTRLTTDPGDGFLDKMPAYVAAEFCTLIGHLESSLRGVPLKERIPDGFENPELRQNGYEVAAKGRESVLNLLETFVEASSKRTKYPLDMFGSALYWSSVNKHNPDCMDVLQFMQEVVEDNLPLAPGDAFIWPIKKRKVFTVATASAEYEISEKRITRILAPKYGDGGIPRFLKRDEVHSLLLEGASYVTTSEAAKALGCSMELCDLLIKRGHVSITPNRDGATRVYRLVHKNEIEVFLRKLGSRVDRNIALDSLVSRRTYSVRRRSAR
ncbi:hypothetical protein AJ87_42540 [Rhizobium yanglingense]|nr:hypothetical protein AJ87_42540 [Rhizobium yanglingense]